MAPHFPAGSRDAPAERFGLIPTGHRQAGYILYCL